MNEKVSTTNSWFEKKLTNISNNGLILILLVLIIATFGIGFAFGTKSQNNFTSNDFTKSLTLRIYKSKGSRDQNKITQKIFKLTDPIQAYLKFSSAEPGTVIQYKLIDSNQKSLQTFEIPLDGNGERYFTISPQILQMKTGTYQVVILEEGNTLQTESFVIE